MNNQSVRAKARKCIVKWISSSYSSGSKRYSTSSSRFVLGIRKEDKNCWERRAPLSPEHVQNLVQQGLDVVVQPSYIRCFADEEYKEAGATISEDFTHVPTIFAVKEVPVPLLLPDKTYAFFSHTIKAQPHNMPLLDAVLERNIRLVDYEKIVNEKNERLVKFGHFAGLSAVVDTIHVLGERLLTHYGYATPFANIGFARNFVGIESAKKELKTIGDTIAKYGLPPELYPFVVTVTGSGSVSMGAKSMLDLLPCKLIDADDLPALWKSKPPATKEQHNFIYLCVATAKDMVQNKVDKKSPFNKSHYYKNPDEYESIFHEKVMPYTRVLLNGIYWDYRYPKLVTLEQSKKLLSENRLPLIVHSDITCDINGSIEFLQQATTINDPSFGFDVKSGTVVDQNEVGEGKIAVLGVDHWPASFSRSATEYFGSTLLPFVSQLARSDKNKPLNEQNLPSELYKAVIANDGKLTPNFLYIDDKRRERQQKIDESNAKKKKVLLLGSGYVVAPIIEYLAREPELIHQITIAGIDAVRGDELVKKYSNPDGTQITSTHLDVTATEEIERLDNLVKTHDIVLSLVPAPLHPLVAKKCVAHKKNMITASYISPAMKDLHDEAKKAGIVLLNEIGLDPGIDHMSVIKILDEIAQKGGQLQSFHSYCGALPAPECADNPLAYKFSWSPRGVLAAAENSALYRFDGKEVSVPGDLLMFTARRPPSNLAYPAFAFEMIPNRDSLKYIPYYGMKDGDINTMIRGTLRFPGFTNLFRAFKHVGLLSQAELPRDANLNWFDVMNKFVTNTSFTSEQELQQELGKRLTVAYQKIYNNAPSYLPPKSTEEIQEDVRSALLGLSKLGLTSKNTAVQATQSTTKLIDVFCKHLENKLSYREKERDFIYMHHEFGVKYPARRELITSTLCLYGKNDKPDGFSATASTVGLPVAISASLLLKGQLPELNGAGVCGPTNLRLSKMVLNELQKEGISLREDVLIQ